MYKRHLLKISLLVILFVFLLSNLSFSETSGTVPGKIRLYLFEGGTGAEEGGINDIHASLGDTITVDVFLINDKKVDVAAIELYFTLDDTYFDIVSQGVNEEDNRYYGHL